MLNEPQGHKEHEENLETIQRYYRVERRDIFFIQSIFESYEGIASVSTVNPKEGIVRLAVSPGSEKDIEMIFDDLRVNGLFVEDLNEQKKINKIQF